MANGQQIGDLVEVLSVLAVWILPLLPEFVILEVHIRYAVLLGCLLPRCLLSTLNDITLLAVENGTCRESLELHNVLRECACLVRKDVANLSEFLIEIAGLRLGRLVLLLIIHHPVPLYKDALAKLHSFERHEQRDGDEVHEGEHPFSETQYNRTKHIPKLGRTLYLYVALNQGTICVEAVAVVELEVEGRCCLISPFVPGPNAADEGCNEAEDHLDGHAHEEVSVEGYLQLRLLDRTFRRVHHHLRVVARVHSYAPDVLRVPQ